MRQFKFLPFLIFLFLIFACNKEVPEGRSNASLYQNEFSNVVSIDEAERELFSFMSSGGLETKGCKARTVVNRYSTGVPLTTKAMSTEAQPYVHIFNFNNNKGFAIVSGDKRVSPILCITDEGSLNEDSVINDPLLLIQLSNLDTYYRLMTGMPVTDNEGKVVTAEEYSPKFRRVICKVIPGDSSDVTPPTPEPTYTLIPGNWEEYSSVGTKLTCAWDQNSPFNENCTTSDGRPAVVGCVPIAVAQIMYYWGKSYYYKDVYWDWSQMHSIINRDTSPYYVSGWSLVKRFLHLLGTQENLDVSYGAEYDTTSNGSGAHLSNVPRTFENFGYSSGGSIEDFNISKLKTNLSYGPVLGSGYAIKKVTIYRVLGIQVDKITTYEKGHAWVYDEVLTKRRLVTKYRDGEYDSSYYETLDMLHINMGYGNNHNGYYLQPFINVNYPPQTRSTSTEGTERYYQYKLQMNCGIRAY